MTRFALAGAAVLLICAPAAAEVADVNCSIVKAFRCTGTGCEDVALNIGIRFNIGTKKGCLIKDGNCAGDLIVETAERVEGDVVVHFKSNGMVIRISPQSGNMVGADASKDNNVFAYGGTCK